MQSNLSIFKIGIGPSSSHTLGPLFAGNLFCKKISDVLNKTVKVKITLFGSLSLTGIGHLSDKAVIWGLCGISPKDLDAKLQEEIIDRVINERKIKLCGIKDIDFNYKEDLVFSSEFLPLHENALTIKALDEKLISGAAIDVYDKEPPLNKDDQLLKFENLILLPHVGYFTKEAMVKRFEIIKDNLASYLKGETKNRVA